MSFGPARLASALEAALPQAATGLAVAVSGGPDSAALLAALRLLPTRTVRGLGVRALHVNHGLQSTAAALEAASVALCARFEVPLDILEVHVPLSEGLSVEAAAREARFRRLSAELGENECLLTAHHRHDQAETLLLQLLRGAGPKGLAAMPVRRRLGAGWHIRPLLDVARGELTAFGVEQSLAAIGDPMNSDPRFERAHLRTTLWPLIEERWPGAAKALARSAAHLAEAQALIEEQGAAIVSRVRDGEALCVRGLRSLSEPEQLHALRYWIAAEGARLPSSVRLPSSARLHEALRQMLAADADHLPAVAWEGHALRRYRDRLFLTAAHPPRLDERLVWPMGERGTPGEDLGPAPRGGALQLALGRALELPPGLGRLRWEPAGGGLDPARLPAFLEVRPRGGSERLRIARGARTRSVRELCQAWGILPWMRDALPFVYAGETLIAVGDLWHNADLSVAAGAPGVRD